MMHVIFFSCKCLLLYVMHLNVFPWKAFSGVYSLIIVDAGHLISTLNLYLSKHSYILVEITAKWNPLKIKL